MGDGLCLEHLAASPQKSLRSGLELTSKNLSGSKLDLKSSPMAAWTTWATPTLFMPRAFWQSSASKLS